MFKYPSGTLDKHLEFNNTYPASQDKQIVGDEQLLQPILRLAHDRQFKKVLK
jgi:hypothetical protein